MSVKIGIYEHYKGKKYRVLGVGQHSETEDSYVVYQTLYGDFGLWLRPLEMFTEEVEVDGQKRPRFKFVEAFPHRLVNSEEWAMRERSGEEV